MTALADILIRRIASTGPINIADYMHECLLHPEHGYYSTRDPFGTHGDFTTAPEISQMFGELLGLSIAQAWIDQGSPTLFTLAELGPGRGTLMADMLRACAKVPGFVDACTVCLVEASDTLRAVQRETLAGHDVQFSTDVQSLPDGPLFLIANEFFDALPVRQFTRHENGWQEHQVGIQNNALALGLSAPAPITALNHRLGDTVPGDIVEICAAGTGIIATISDRIAGSGGAAIIIDYGDWRSKGDTLQAVKSHAFCGPLDFPGQSDLTAHVDFEALALAASATQTTPLTPQGVLLERLGITHRAQALAKSLGGTALQDHIAAHRRLTHPDEMGTLFKAIALFARGCPPPPGFVA